MIVNENIDQDIYDNNDANAKLDFTSYETINLMSLLITSDNEDKKLAIDLLKIIVSKDNSKYNIDKILQLYTQIKETISESSKVNETLQNFYAE